MAVILQPGSQPVLMADIPQATYIIVGNTVGHQTPQVPKETIREIGTADHNAIQHRKIRNRIVPVTFFENIDHIVRPVLPAGFIAVLHHDLECFPVGFRNAFQDLADKGVEMESDVFAAHLIDLRPCCFGSRGRVRHTRRKHNHPPDHPVSFRHFPVQHAMLRESSHVFDLLRRNQ